MQGYTDQLRQINTAAIRAILRQGSGCTKTEIATASGLSYATCNTILNKLVQGGEVLALEQARSGGRPATVYAYNRNHGLLLCAVLGNEGGKPSATLFTFDMLGGEVRRRSQSASSLSPAGVAALLAEELQREPGIKTISLGIPGVVQTGQQILLCDLPLLQNQPLGSMLSEQLQLPVILENDMNAVALGFHTLEQLSATSPSAALIFIQGNCPGSGLVVDGKLVRGATNFAGEISFLPGGPGRKALLQSRPRAQMSEVVADTVSSLVAVLNPAHVLLCGSQLQAEQLDEIETLCCARIPAQHLPQLHFSADETPYYLHGLFMLAQQALETPLQMVRQKY